MKKATAQIALEALTELVRNGSNDANALAIAAKAISALDQEISHIADPVYLLNGARVKLNFNTQGNMTSLRNLEHELQGRWVAFVAAENEMHLKAELPEPAVNAELLEACKKHMELMIEIAQELKNPRLPLGTTVAASVRMLAEAAKESLEAIAKATGGAA